MEKIIPDIPALEREAESFVRTRKPLKSGATLVTLSGELGAGKTAFTKAVARSLGVTEDITSPTFVIEKVYALPREAGFARLVHIDAYRLTTGRELAALAFDELMHDPKNLMLLEWPEMVAEALPEPAVRISLSVLPGGAREILFT